MPRPLALPSCLVPRRRRRRRRRRRWIPHSWEPKKGWLDIATRGTKLPMMLPACLPAAVAVGHLNPQVCENELVETVQVIGGEQVRERERERRRRKRDKDTACRRLRGPSFPASCLLPHILRSSGASRAHRSSAPPPLRPPARLPARACQRAWNEAREAFRQAAAAAAAATRVGIGNGRTDLSKGPRRRPAARSFLCGAVAVLAPFPFVGKLSADALLPRSVPPYLCMLPGFPRHARPCPYP